MKLNRDSLRNVIIVYRNLVRFARSAEKVGIDISESNLYCNSIELLSDTILDIFGVPEDETLEKEDVFCRDGLFDYLSGVYEQENDEPDKYSEEEFSWVCADSFIDDMLKECKEYGWKNLIEEL
jgi:hypothetical protein